MTRVDFYVLADADFDAKFRFTCRLAYRANRIGNYVQVRTASRAASEALDKLMWSYPENHFVPHAVASDSKNSALTLIGNEEPPPSADQVLINLADDVPNFFGRYERVVEVVIQSEKELGRDRYRHYRDRGYPLQYHELDHWEKQ
jgi:DNA polymerase-3 subunit chi